MVVAIGNVSPVPRLVLLTLRDAGACVCGEYGVCYGNSSSF